MRVAVMQPYLFPYLGYFQLMRAADQFVLLDDVQFIRRGWINRNRILLGGREYTFTIPVEQASQNKLIQDTTLQADDQARRKLVRTLAQAYVRAPYFAACFPILEQVLLQPTSLHISLVVLESLQRITRYLEWQPQLHLSSQLPKPQRLAGADRIVAICQRLGADEYVNMEAGGHLYSAEHFAQHGIQLRLLRAQLPPYVHGAAAFVPGLSILDVLMHNSPEWIRQSLNRFELV